MKQMTIISLFLLVAVVAYAFFKKQIAEIYRKLTINNELAIFNNSTYAVQFINTMESAYAIHDAFYGSLWSMYEDEEKAVETLLKVPKPLISELAIYYGKIDGNHLFNDLQSFLSKEQYNSIKNLIV